MIKYGNVGSEEETATAAAMSEKAEKADDPDLVIGSVTVLRIRSESATHILAVQLVFGLG